MTPQANYLPKDTSFGERIVRLETLDETQAEQIYGLAVKIDKLVDAVGSMKTGQEVILAQFAEFEKQCNDRTEFAFKVVEDYKKTVERMDAKFHCIDAEFLRQTQEVEKGQWLITWANEFRDNLPKKVASGICKFIMLPIALLAVFMDRAHFIDLTWVLKVFK